MSISIGIDPGKSGGLSVVDGSKVLAYKEMPLLEGELDTSSIICLLIKWVDDYSVENVYIEVQQAMGGQGVTSTFTTGYNYGILIGILCSIGLPIIKVRPKVWQEVFKYTSILPELEELKMKETKKKSLSACYKLFPLIPLMTPRGRWMDGISDSILIGFYGSLLP